MAGDRQLVREAIASYFGGTLQTSDAGIYFQNGPLTSLGLGTAYPYTVKGTPDDAYTEGQESGVAWGAVLTVHLNETKIDRRAIGGPTGGWRNRNYQAVCDIRVISYEPHLETADAGLDELVDGFLNLIYADRTLGTTSDIYPTGRLITQAGEGPDGIVIAAAEFEQNKDRSKAWGGLAITFQALTEVQA